MKKQLSLSLLSVVMGTIALPAMGEIVISQYVEGSGFNKAIEIANTGDQDVSLDHFKLAISRDGSGHWDSEFSLAGKGIAAKDVLVVVNSQASSDILAVSDEVNNTVISFNGNDPVALLQDDVVHDVIGVMGSDNWGKDITLVRNADSLSPSATYVASQWEVKAKDNIDGLGSFDTGVPPETFTCTVNGAEPEFTSIHAIQGEGSTSPFIQGYPYITDESFFVKGVVSAVTTGLTKGFYLQSLDDDENANTSEGLFVYTNQSSSNLKPGDVVCVNGKIQEYYNLTQLNVDNKHWIKEGEQAAPKATAIEIQSTDTDFAQTLERYEGMLVKVTPALDMRVTRTFSFDYDAYRNNLVLAQGQVNTQPNQKYAAGSEAAQQQSQENAQRRLFVESDEKAPNGVIPYYPDFGRSDVDQDGSTEDYIRIDDRIAGLEGVLSYSYNEYRLIATNELTRDNFVHNDPRTNAPVMKVGGDLRIASFNVLNYFNSPFGGDSNSHGDNRGAETYAEFEVQQEKIVNAIIKLDADIIGLMEIENNGFGEGGAIYQLVAQLNANLPEDKHYRVVALDTNHDGQINAMDSVGTDVITTGVIYRDRMVSLDESRIIAMPSQQAPEVLDDEGQVIEDGKNYQRQTLAPTFNVLGTQKKLTVAVNHFKSKGSTCWEDAAPVAEGGQGMEDPDRQGSCENFRVAAAVALGEALEKIDGHKVILGDMNAYAKEDPILILTDYSPQKYGKTILAARDTFIDGQVQFGDQGAVIEKSYGYLNAVDMIHPDSWSYSYNDEVGSMDHLLISPSLKPYVVDATDWHINSSESSLFDYTDEYKGDLPKYRDQFRSSDHDPAVLELKMGGALGGVMALCLCGIAAWRQCD